MDWVSLVFRVFFTISTIVCILAVAARASYTVTSYLVAARRVLWWARIIPPLVLCFWFVDSTMIVGAVVLPVVLGLITYALAALVVTWNRRQVAMRAG